MFLLYFDYPEKYNRAMEKIIQAYDIIMGTAKDLGINIIGYGAPGGTEFTSPGTWKQAIVPTSVQVEQLARKHDLYTTYHCCGKVNTLIPEGFMNEISPTILETLAPPPVGNVDNLGKMRSLLNKDIITHGNMDLTFLRDSTAEQVKRRALDIIEETAGYPHIIGAADACLWPGTPLENLKVICDLFN